MTQTLQIERTETSVPFTLTLGSGETGLAPTVAIRDPENGNYLDFSDDTFKAAAWTTRQLALTEVSAANSPGRYEVRRDVSVWVGLSAGANRVIAEFEASPAVGTRQASDTYELLDHLYDVAISTDILSDATPFQGADVAAIFADTAAIDARLPPDPADESIQLAAHAQTQADIAAIPSAPTAGAVADAVWDEAIAGHVGAGSFGEEVQAHSTSGEIAALNDLSQAQILSDATPFAGANVDAAISSRESEASAAARAVTDQAEHDTTQAAIAALPVPPTAAAIATAVLQEAIIANAIASPGSMAEYLRVMRSLVLGNYIFDNQTYNPVSKFLTAGRIRCFDTAAAVGAATEGGAGEGEFSTFTVAGTEHATVSGQPRLIKVSG